MLDFMAIAKALADENRVRLLLALQKQELCVCQLIELIGLAPSTVSKHMSILRQARLVEARVRETVCSTARMHDLPWPIDRGGEVTLLDLVMGLGHPQAERPTVGRIRAD